MVYLDNTFKAAKLQDWDYWKSKDGKDDLDAKITAKFCGSYTANNYSHIRQS